MEKIFDNVFETPLLDSTPEKVDRDENFYSPSERNKIDVNKEWGDPETGWVYAVANKRGKYSISLGKPLRKYYSNLYSYGVKPLYFWRPKVDDLASCEEKRWKAVQYQKRQITPMLKVFADIKKFNKTFRAMQPSKGWPGFRWAIFDKPSSEGGIGHRWAFGDEDKMDKIPIRQDLGDAWFEYEARSNDIRKRVGHFQTLFDMAIQKKYHKAFYGTYVNFGPKIQAIINGRTYIIGNKDSYGFGVIAGPEDIVVEVINREVGLRHSDQKEPK